MACTGYFRIQISMTRERYYMCSTGLGKKGFNFNTFISFSTFNLPFLQDRLLL
jgi:hypothetical protein